MEEDYSADYTESKVGSLQGATKSPQNKLANPPSMAQLHASPGPNESKPLQLDQKKGILNVNSAGGSDEDYSADNVSYEMSQ